MLSRTLGQFLFYLSFPLRLLLSASYFSFPNTSHTQEDLTALATAGGQISDKVMEAYLTLLQKRLLATFVECYVVGLTLDVCYTIVHEKATLR